MKNPLNQEHCNCLNKALESAANTAEFLKACQKCGLPVEELIAENNRQRQQCEAIKAQFFPNNP